MSGTPHKSLLSDGYSNPPVYDENTNPYNTQTASYNQSLVPSYQQQSDSYNPYNPSSSSSAAASNNSNNNGLPPGWYVYKSADDVDYYYNSMTMVTQWEHPVTGIAQNPYLLPNTVPSHVPSHPWEEKKHGTANPTPGQEPVWDSHDPNNPQSIDNIVNSINNRVDSNGNPILDSEQIASIPLKIFPLEQHARETSCKQIIFGTIYGAKFLSAMSILFIITLVLSLILCASLNSSGSISPYDPYTKSDDPALFFIPLFIVYGIYAIIFLLPGILSIICCCATVGQPCCLDFNIFNVIWKCGSKDPYTITKYIDKQIQSTPSIYLHVECYHYETHTSRDSDGKETTSEERVTTYSSNRYIPIIRHRDISVPSSIILDSLYIIPSSMIVTEYIHTYDLHPLQQELLQYLKQQYYNENMWRDSYTDVDIIYTTSCPDKRDVDLLIHNRYTISYILSVLLLNPLIVLISLFTPITYLSTIMLSNTVYKKIPIPLVKYIHIGIPSSSSD